MSAGKSRNGVCVYFTGLIRVLAVRIGRAGLGVLGVAFVSKRHRGQPIRFP